MCDEILFSFLHLFYLVAILRPARRTQKGWKEIFFSLQHNPRSSPGPSNLSVGPDTSSKAFLKAKPRDLRELQMSQGVEKEKEADGGAKIGASIGGLGEDQKRRGQLESFGHYGWGVR